MHRAEQSEPDCATRVLLLPSTRRDGNVVESLIARAGLSCTVCVDAKALALEMQGGAGALLMTDSAFLDPSIDQLWTALAQQPAWSDLPAIVLCQAGAQCNLIVHGLQRLRNLTVLEKPASSRTLISTIKSALRGRERQYQMRDQLAALQASQAALQAASQELLDSNRRKDEFLAMLAHELRNPLAPILNASEVLARVNIEPRVQNTVHLLKRQTTHLARLVDDLLDLSRITAGRVELRRAPLDIGAVIAQACEIVEPVMREKRHTLLLATGYEPLYVNGDHARLVQSIANILNNAAKYTDPGGEIRVEVQRRNDRVEIAISDTGIGIAPNFLPRIFDLFVQADRSLDRSQGGLGIGLCVVKRLIEMHDGDVVATSAGLGCGATFRINLPLIASPNSALSIARRPPSPSKKILIVDDNRDAANSLAMLLELEGHRTTTAYTAEQALELAASIRPDVAILDIGLPEMDGYQIATRLRATLGTTQLIALTGYGQADDIARARLAGFHAHLIKPVDFARLSRLIAHGGETLADESESAISPTNLSKATDQPSVRFSS